MTRTNTRLCTLATTLALQAFLALSSSVLATAAADVSGCGTEISGLKPQPAVLYFAEALETHPIVFLGESHELRQLHDLYGQLVGSAAVREQLDDVFVEFLSSFHQGLLDRYLLELEAMSFEDLAPAWRDVPGIILHEGDNMAAHQFIQQVRAVNEKLAKDQRIRVLAGDSPIDWSALQSRNDWARQLNRRDRRFLEVLWDEVIDYDRRVLAILGRGHVKRVDPSPPNWINLVDLVETRAPGSTHVVHLVPKEASPTGWTAPAVLKTEGNCLADLRLEPEAPDLAFGKQVDAIIFVGSSQTLEIVPSRPYPESFVREMTRRNRIID